MERHGLSSPAATVKCVPTGELSPMAFLVGVTAVARVGDTPTRCAQRLSAAVEVAAGAVKAALNRGRIALPPRRGRRRSSLFLRSIVKVRGNRARRPFGPLA